MKYNIVVNNRTKQITTIGLLTALSVVLFSLIRIPLFGNIRLDLSYIVLTVAICKCGMLGSIFVGGVGALLESVIFGVNGLSISWIIANITIAFVGSIFYKLAKESKKDYLFIIGIFIGCALGLIVLKTIIECALFDIPLLVKIPKNIVAFISDFLCMILGVVVAKRFD